MRKSYVCYWVPQHDKPTKYRPQKAIGLTVCFKGPILDYWCKHLVEKLKSSFLWSLWKLTVDMKIFASSELDMIQEVQGCLINKITKKEKWFTFQLPTTRMYKWWVKGQLCAFNKQTRKACNYKMYTHAIYFIMHAGRIVILEIFVHCLVLHSTE